MQELETALTRLRNLSPGWKDGKGEVIAPSTLETTRLLLSQCLSQGMTFPSIGPTENGDVIVQWAKKSLFNKRSFCILLTIQTVTIELDTLSTGEVLTELFTDQSIALLVDRLHSLMDGLDEW